jgi:hypothetical protein
LKQRLSDQYVDLHPSGFDYLLTAIAGCLTAYAAGMSVSNPTIGWIFVVLNLLGVWISYAVTRSIQNTRIQSWSGFIYTAGMLGAFFSARSLVVMLPDNPFTAQIFVCGLLLWMLVFGSFLVWNDQTLLFQAVPSIAIFGLVGCYDTYRDATWMFFGFLLCFATLLARVHGRVMLRQAKDSGYSQTGDRMDRSATELQRMRSGPWRWVAGPQWALGSAFVVILFSFMGAPIIRESVQGVAGSVRVSAPLSPRTFGVAASNIDPLAMKVGNGPNELSPLPLFRASLDRPRYMRTGIYQTYGSVGWTSNQSAPVGDRTTAVLARSGDRRSIKEIADPKTITFEIEPLTSRLGSVPIPGELIGIRPADNTSIKFDGTIAMITTGKVNVYNGSSIVSNSGSDPVDAVRDLVDTSPQLVATGSTSHAVYELANKVAATGKTDYERAILIKHEIERRAQYNLNAAATPAGKDPVESFLFDTREGYCDLFASAMVLMARSVGIPARLVTGYYPMSGEKDSDGRFVVKESEKHAWAELLFDGHGWVVFDATEGAEEVDGGERGSANTSPLSNPNITRLLVDALIVIAAIVGIAISIRAVFRSGKLPLSRSELDREYLKFAEALSKATGKNRNFDQTPAEYLAECAPLLHGFADQAKRVSDRFERMFYSPEGTTRDSFKILQTEVANMKSALKGIRPR